MELRTSENRPKNPPKRHHGSNPGWSFIIHSESGRVVTELEVCSIGPAGQVAPVKHADWHCKLHVLTAFDSLVVTYINALAVAQNYSSCLGNIDTCFKHVILKLLIPDSISYTHMYCLPTLNDFVFRRDRIERIFPDDNLHCSLEIINNLYTKNTFEHKIGIKFTCKSGKRLLPKWHIFKNKKHFTALFV